MVAFEYYLNVLGNYQRCVGICSMSLIQAIKGQIVHNRSEPMKNICVMCRHLYNTATASFEQRLVADEDFCLQCWNDIINRAYDNDFDNDFSSTRFS
jgi:hypothetical protein